MSSTKKRRLEDLSTDEFLAVGLDSDSDESDQKASLDQKASKEEEHVKQRSKRRKQAHAHKESLDKLKEKDPELYQFLQKEDKSLLAFDPSDVSESEDGSGEEEGGSEEDKNESEGDVGESEDEEQRRHKLPEKLEVASDSEDDFSEEEEESVRRPAKEDSSVKVTLKMINQWSKKLREKNSMVAIHEAVSAFKAAVQQAADQPSVGEKYRVEGGAVFNAIVRMCITELHPALLRLLEIPSAQSADTKKTAKSLTENSKWKKVKLDVKSYLINLLQLAGHISEPGILDVILKHVYRLVVFYTHFPKIAKALIKTLVAVWSTGEETSRVLAFFSINSVTRKLQESFLEYVLKQMYMAYVKNCKFTSPSTLPMINFMQRSLVEVFAIDTAVTYQYAFVYIRQLAIHLRNAITMKKPETTQAVYNWQFVHSLALWARLISQLWPNDTLEPLIYPLVQVVMGTVKLVPSPRYYPLRFHCVKSLNMLSEATGTFIPVLPLLTEVLELTDFNKKSKSASVKSFNFACILKLSKIQVHDKAFKDGVMDNLYEQLLESLTIHAHSVGFPELVLPAVLQLKAFLKTCRIPAYAKVMKTLLHKVQENSDVITARRKKAALTLADSVAVDAWERKCKEEGTPLAKYYAQYKKKRESEVQREIVQRDRDLISSEDLPEIVRPKKGPQKATEDERRELKGLFPSDSDSSEEEEEDRFLLRDERTKGKKKVRKENESSDEYSDFNEDEMAALDKSASEDDGADDGGDVDATSDVSDAHEDSDGDGSDDSDADAESGEGDDDAKDDGVNDSDASDDGDDIVEDFAFSDDDSH